MRLPRLERVLSPSQVLTLLFVSLVALGAGLLAFPWSAHGRPLSFVDALFTSTSAVCVTGLTVVDTGSRLTVFGQCVLLGLIQAGGLGYMTIATLVAVFLGRMALEERLIMHEALEQFSFEDVARFARRVLKLTLLIEGLGAAALWYLWRGEGSPGAVLYRAAFHSVAAFCNSGFSLQADSLVRWRGDLAVNLVFMALIVSGGLGFIVLSDFVSYAKARKRFTTHSRIVLAATGLLVAAGAAFLLLNEWRNPATLGLLPRGERVLAGVFQSVTARTAGFNTLAVENLQTASLLFLVFLMFVGASPGGTGGGVKTTTIYVVAAVTWATLRGRSDANLFGRRMPGEVIRKAFTVVVAALFALTVFTVVLLETERRFGLTPVLFEVVSAFGTVGLSMGITAQLSAAGKAVLVAAMFVGRLGPLVVGAAALREGRLPFRYAEEKILVG